MNEEIYNDLAEIYDLLMADVPYIKWVNYIESVFKRFAESPATILDLACGTGRVSFELVERGYRVLGIDRSEAMLSRAEAKRKPSSDNPGFICQDLSAMQMALPPADAAVCLFDSLNYITSYADFCNAFRGIHAYLKPGALFIFDVNTEKALSDELFTQDNLSLQRAPLYYIWKSNYDPSSRLIKVRMHFLVRQTDGGYRSFEEEHWQRAYTQEEISCALANAGFALDGFYDGDTFKKADEGSERMFVVARSL